MRCFALLFVALLGMFTISNSFVIDGCGVGNIDMSALANQDVFGHFGGWTYVLRMCGVVHDSICAADTTTINSMLCQRTNSTTQNAWNLMTWSASAGVWGIDNRTVTYQLATGEQCNSQVTALRSTTIRFECDAAATSPYIVSVTEPSICQYRVVVRTNLVCSTGCSYLGVDLSPIFPNGQDLRYNSTNGEYAWFLNMCQRVQDPYCQNDTTTSNSMVCQRRSDGLDAYGIAMFDPNAISFTVVNSGNSAGLLATSANGEYCAVISGNRVARIHLVCDRSLAASASYIAGISETSNPVCNYEITVFTSVTCPFVPSSTGGSGALSSSWWPEPTNTCRFQIRSTGRSIDLTAMMNMDDLHYEGFVGGTYYNVYFHICGVVRNAQCLNDSTTYNAMICQASLTNAADNWALGTYVTQVPPHPQAMIWSDLPYGFQYYQQTGEMCGANPRSTVVQFICNSQMARPTIISISEPSTCQYVLVVHTTLACNGTNEPPKSSDDEPIYRNCEYKQNGVVLPFKTLNPTDGDLQITVAGASGSTQTIYMRLCEYVSERTCRTDITATKSMICQKVPSGDSISLADYNENNMIWGQVGDQQAIQLKMINGEVCGSKRRTVAITFICDLSYSTTTILTFTEPLTCEYKMTVAANSLICNFNPAAKNSSSDNMNGGMIALIVIVIILGLIILVGACAAWRYYDRPYAFQKEQKFEKNVEMQGGEGHNTSYEVEESQSTV